MKEPLVSIIVPVYNVSKYLQQCLDSIISQTYKNLEIILIDDGSTDDSGKICDKYALADSRIKVIHKKNGGLSDARNIGIANVTGKYIAFIDSDDYVHEKYIQHMLEVLLKYQADVVICQYKKVIAKSKSKNEKDITVKLDFLDSKSMLRKWHGKHKHIETMAWNKLYKAELFTETKIRYPKGLYNEDVQTTHLIINQANKIVISNQVLYYYVQRHDSIMRAVNVKKIEDCIWVQKSRLDFFINNGYDEAYKRLYVKLLKYYILMYFKVKDKSIKKKLYSQYAEDKAKGNNKMGLLWERLFFLMFESYYGILKTFKNLCISS